MPGPQVCGGCPFIHGFVGGLAPSAAAREPAALRFSRKVGAGLRGVEDAAPYHCRGTDACPTNRNAIIARAKTPLRCRGGIYAARGLPANDRLPYIRGRTMFAPYVLYPGSLCNAGLWRCSVCGGVRAPRPTSSGTAVRRAAYPQAAVQCGGYGNVPGASRTPPPTVAGGRMPALHGRAGHARPLRCSEGKWA